MLTSIEIKRFRGIEEGRLADLTPLVIIVGPNGAGKSAILEAMLIGASPTTLDAVIQVYRRHQAGGSGPRWLLWRAGAKGQTEIAVKIPEIERRCSLLLERGHPEAETHVQVAVIDAIHVPPKGKGDLGRRKGKLVFDSRDASIRRASMEFSPLSDIGEVAFIEPYATGHEKPLPKLYTQAAERGRKEDLLNIISAVYPRCSGMEILTEDDAPILHLYSGAYPVPATLAGDGIVSLLRLSLELAGSGGGVALVEEPETHQHPAALRQSARAILAAVRRNIQVVITTHSLELIDDLLAESCNEDLQKLSLYRVQLDNGHLKSHRHAGPEAAFARRQIEDDLR